MMSVKKFAGITIGLTLLAATAAVAAKAQKKQNEPKTVSQVDLQRYAGKWFEVARFPNSFQNKCAGNVTATYTRKDNGRIEVINECRKQNGEIDRATGEAKVVDEATNAKLEVRFAPAFLSFIPAVWGDYWILDLDANYQYAAVGDPSRKYLWILSRTRELDEATYQNIVQRVATLGFNTAQLVKTPQNLPSSGNAVADKQASQD